MKREVIEIAIYVVISVIIMFILKELLNTSYENANSTYIVKGYILFRNVVFTTLGVLLGFHNVIRYIKAKGEWKANYYLVILASISFIFGYRTVFAIYTGSGLIIDIIGHSAMDDYAAIAFGYILTLIMQRKFI